MGRKTNQKFVSVPTARLKKRIQQLAGQYSIEFIEQEESYSSQASALDLDEIPVYGEIPEGWKPSGKRVKRGLYRALMVTPSMQTAMVPGILAEKQK